MRNLLVLLACLVLVSGCSGRSLGNSIDDKFTAPAVGKAIKNAHSDLNSPISHISRTSYNGIVLLTGQTPTAELKQLAGNTARQVNGVKQVHNEISVGPPINALVRSNDAMLTSKVRAKLVSDSNVPSSRVKVITEDGVVYLLGIVDRSQAAHITNAVRQVGGVQKIVRLFEYIN